MRSLILCLVIGSVGINHAAMAVFDSAAASNAAQQLAKAKEQLAKLQAQIDSLENIHDTMTGTLQDMGNLTQNLGQVQSMVDDMTSTAFDVGDKLASEFDFRNVKDVSGYLDEIYKTVSNPAELKQLRDFQHKYRQSSFKAALESAESMLAFQPETLQRINHLANKIPETANIKESMDLTNLYLNEMVGLQAKTVELLAELVRSNSAGEFEGVEKPARKSLEFDEKDSPFKNAPANDWKRFL